MSILVDPDTLARRMMPKSKASRLVTQKLTLNRIVLKQLANSGVLKSKSLERVALKVIRQYRRAYKAELKDGASKASALSDALNKKKLMVQRVQNLAARELVSEVKKKYRGEFYVWLPSSSGNPDPEHELKYGEKFQVGKGEAPGERPGCQCGMEILVKETELEI